MIFVDKNRKALVALAENIANFGVEEVSGIVAGDVAMFSTAEKFEIIFVDPPYNNFQIEEFCHLAEFLTKDGLLAVSHPEEEPVEFEGVELVSDKKYARARIAIFEKS